MSENVYEQALEVLDEFGWTQGWLGSKETGFCTIGALLNTEKGCQFGNNENGWAAANKMLFLVPVVEGPNGDMQHSIASFNDHKNTTEEDIRLLLKKAAVEVTND